MKKLLIYYSFIIVVVVVIGGYISAQTINQLAMATVFYPLLLYFTLKVRPKRNKAIILPVEAKKHTPSVKKKTKKSNAEKIEKAEVVKLDEGDRGDYDKERRAFLKLIGSAGISVFIFSIFGVKKANAAFFGSTPGPGTVALKNIAGDKIDPAEKLPTDGYGIAEIDDSVPAYYGFTDKDGAWFIMKEDEDGAYRYIRGASDFINVTTGWPNRASLSYNYFESVF